MTEWFNNENFWIDFYSFMFPDERFKEAKDQTEQIVSLLHLKKGKVLDLCCGPGRFSIEFAKQGFDVTGVDKTKFLLDKAKKRAKSKNINVDFIKADMLNYINPDTFDLVINMFTSFGYFEKEEDDLMVLENVYTSLKKDGKLVIDIMGKEILAKIFQPTLSTKGNDGSLWIQQPEIVENWTRVKNEWIFIKGSTIKTHHIIHTIYSGKELMDLLHQAGFEDVQLLGDFSGSEYGINSSRLIAIATK